jgi:hypothetical protein
MIINGSPLPPTWNRINSGRLRRAPVSRFSSIIECRALSTPRMRPQAEGHGSKPRKHLRDVSGRLDGAGRTWQASRRPQRDPG